MTTTRRYFGESDVLAHHYVWFYETSLDANGELRYFPAGTKKPNDFGLFSLYDGVREWGHEAVAGRRIVLGLHNGMDPDDPETFSEVPSSDLPQARNGFYGFRIARTIQSDR